MDDALVKDLRLKTSDRLKSKVEKSTDTASRPLRSINHHIFGVSPRLGQGGASAQTPARLTSFRLGPMVFLLTLAIWPVFFVRPVEAQRDYIQPIPITSTQLTEAYARSFHQADATYTGKLLLITGRIKSIRPPSQRNYNYQFDKLYSFMTLDTGSGNRPLGVYFWDWEAEKLGTRRPQVNDMVTVMGFCQGVTPHLSIIEACIYPAGCGGPKRNFDGNYYQLPPSPVPRR